MFTRVIYRSACPIVSSSLKIARAAANASLRCYRNICIYTPSPSCNSITHGAQRRLYSQQVTVEEMIVDFDHVKKATKDENILIVDVREPDEIKEHGKIPNSINVPLGNVTTVLSQMPEAEFKDTYNRRKPSEDTEIIFYCMIGKRSGMAQQNAQNLGYKKVKNYLGSFNDWAAKTKS